MCLSVYLASDEPVPVLAWNEAEPAFYVEPLGSGFAELERRFSGSHLYYVGSHEGCGCGFIKDGEEGAELASVADNYRQLAAYLRRCGTAAPATVLFACWSGDEGAELVQTLELGVERFLEPAFEFQERVLYRIVPENGD